MIYEFGLLWQLALAAPVGLYGLTMVFTRLLHDCLPSPVRAGAASGVGALSSMNFVPFSLLFGVVSQHLGIFHAGWMVVGVTLLTSALLVSAPARPPGPTLERIDGWGAGRPSTTADPTQYHRVELLTA